jgi:small subunit ribosomal protein S6
MKYELALVIKPLSNEDIKEKVMKKVESTVAELGGTIGKYNVLGKRLLAYPISKNKEGYYIFAKLSLESKNASKFDKELSLNTDILRFMRVTESTL